MNQIEDYFLYKKSHLLLKALWLIKHILGYVVGFPFPMTVHPNDDNKLLFLSFLRGMISDFSPKLVEDFPLDFFGLEKDKYTQVVDQHCKRYTTYFLLGSIPFFIGSLFLYYFLPKAFDAAIPNSKLMAPI